MVIYLLLQNFDLGLTCWHSEKARTDIFLNKHIYVIKIQTYKHNWVIQDKNVLWTRKNLSTKNSVKKITPYCPISDIHLVNFQCKITTTIQTNTSWGVFWKKKDCSRWKDPTRSQRISSCNFFINFKISYLVYQHKNE